MIRPHLRLDLKEHINRISVQLAAHLKVLLHRYTAIEDSCSRFLDHVYRRVWLGSPDEALGSPTRTFATAASICVNRCYQLDDHLRLFSAFTR